MKTPAEIYCDELRKADPTMLAWCDVYQDMRDASTKAMEAAIAAHERAKWRSLDEKPVTLVPIIIAGRLEEEAPLPDIPLANPPPGGRVHFNIKHMTLKIESKIPLPKVKNTRPKTSAEAAKMKPGDSVLVDHRTASSIRSYGHYHGWSMTQETQDCGKIRVWRAE